MSMTRTNPFLSAKSALLLAAGLLAACAAVPATAQESAPQPATAFGQPMPRQYFLNKLNAPPREQSEGAASGGAAGGQTGGGQARAQAAEEEGNGPFPKRYLLNRMFSSDDFGEEPAANAPAAPAPAGAPAPAAKTP